MAYRDGFHEHYADELIGLYDCPDRLVFLAYNQLLQSGGGFRQFWRELHGGDDSGLTTDSVASVAGDMTRRLNAYCGKNGIPLLEVASDDRKGEAAEARIPKDPAFTGLFLVQKSLAPAPVWHVERHGTKGYIYKLYRPKKWPRVRIVFFHIMDPEWGHVTIRMCCHPPFGAMVILNGHERVRRLAEKRGVEFRTDGNCFIEGSDFDALDTLGGKLAASAMDVQKVADRWIYSCCLCFGLSTALQEATGFRYDYSVFQMEYSRNYVFTRGSAFDQGYQCLIDRTRRRLGLELLKTILGFKHRPHKRPIIAITRSCDAKGEYDLIRWAQPGRTGGHRMAGINLNNVRVRTVLSLLPLLSTAPGGFSSADLQKQLRANGGLRKYTIAMARYDLRKLRGKGLVKAPHRRKYEVPAEMAAKVCACFTLNDEVIRPVFASCGRHRRGAKPQHPVDVIRKRMRDDLVELFGELGIAA